MNVNSHPLSPGEEQHLLAGLHLRAVLPTMALLAPHDATLRAAATGRDDLPVNFQVPRVGRATLVLARDGHLRLADAPPGGSLSLWFPTPGQFLRSMAHQVALALPLSGWIRLGQLSRLKNAGQRFEALLRDPTIDPVLFAYGNLAVGLAGAAVWLRIHPRGPQERARLLDAVITISCPALPTALWLDCRDLTNGAGPPPRPPLAEITFRNLDTILAELNHRLDTLAALGSGELRIRGHLPVAERLGLVIAEVARRLDPAAAKAHIDDHFLAAAHE